jgi:hypothetical protein
MPGGSCAKCDEGFKSGDSILNALGKKYHPTCFVCAKCNKPFATSAGQSSLILENDEPVHEGCANLEGTTTIVDDGEGKDLGTCLACNKPLGLPGDAVVSISDNERYHQRCFVCSKCNKTFDGGHFFTDNGKPCHPECMKTQDNKKQVVKAAMDTLDDQSSCQACGKPFGVEGRRRFVDGIGHFHPKCFVCATCGNDFDNGRFFLHPTTKKPTCKTCIENEK